MPASGPPGAAPEPPLRGDLDRVAAVDTRSMAWSASPSPSVWRKRLHRVGSAEAGQVTSVVRYAPGAAFPAHAHPGGEEILVLGGVFSDEHGDWLEGAYLLHPEGFRHAPFSKPGCEIFVKLRQLPGRDRERVALDTLRMPWQPARADGVESKLLYAQRGFDDTVFLERWRPGAAPAGRRYEKGVEIFVLAGAFTDEHGTHGEGAWLRLPRGASHRPRADSESGCTLYVKRSGLPYLEPAR